jgi:hypothetical protein
MSKPSLLDTFDNIGLALISTGASEHMGVLALASTVDPAAKRRIKDLFDEGLNPRAPGAFEFLRANIIQGREYNTELMRVHSELINIHWEPEESIRDMVSRIERLAARHRLIVGGSAPQHNIRDITRVAIANARRADDSHIRSLLECFHDISLMLVSNEEFFVTLCGRDERLRATHEWAREARTRHANRAPSPSRRKAPPQRSPPPAPTQRVVQYPAPIPPVGGQFTQEPYCSFHQMHGHNTSSCRAAAAARQRDNPSGAMSGAATSVWSPTMEAKS